MKDGQTPIHIQRWAPADYLADEHVKLLQARRDYLTIAFYRHFIDTSFVAGGDLPADPEMLAAIVLMPKKDVVRALAFCVGRLLFPDGDRLYQPRVRREIAEELEFRVIQRANGAKGGRRATQRLALPSGEPIAKDSPSPPAPAPAPAPAPIALRLSPEKPASLFGDDGSTSSGQKGQKAKPLSTDELKAIPLPASLNSVDVRAAVNEFIDYRVQIKAPFKTRLGVEGMLRLLEPLGQALAIEAMRITREKEWQGVEHGISEMERRQSGGLRPGVKGGSPLKMIFPVKPNRTPEEEARMSEGAEIAED